MSDEDIRVKAVRLADENYQYYGTERSEELGLAVRALADEVEALRRGEFICQRCHHRKDAESGGVDF